MFLRGAVFALTGKASEAIQVTASGMTALRSTGATLWMPVVLTHLGRAYAEVGQFDDACPRIGEAMTVMETTKEKWHEAEVNRVAGEIALKSPARLDARHLRLVPLLLRCNRLRDGT